EADRMRRRALPVIPHWPSVCPCSSWRRSCAGSWNPQTWQERVCFCPARQTTLPLDRRSSGREDPAHVGLSLLPGVLGRSVLRNPRSGGRWSRPDAPDTRRGRMPMMRPFTMRKVLYYGGNVLAVIGVLLLGGSVVAWQVGPELLAELY